VTHRLVHNPTLQSPLPSTEYWVLGTEYWVLGTGYWVLGTDY
jgi:hypothetical protein